MAQDKTIFGPFGDRTEFDETSVDEPLVGPAGGPATTKQWQRNALRNGLDDHDQVTATMQAPPVPAGSYEDTPGAPLTFHEGSLDAALTKFGDEVVGSASVNLQVVSPPDYGDLTIERPPHTVAQQNPQARGSVVGQKTIRMSNGHPLKKQFPDLHPTALHDSGPHRTRSPSKPPMRARTPSNPPMRARTPSNPPMRARAPSRPPRTPPAKGSQVAPRLSSRESQPVPIRVERKASQPVRVNRRSSQPVPALANGPGGSLAQINSDDADPELKKGARLGNYEIVRKIGQGGMGVVYEARHLLLPRRVAIKFLLVNNAHDEDQIRRFLGEAVASAQIDHRGVVDIYDYGYDERNHAYLVMEFVDGRSLQAVMKRGGQIPLSASMRIARDVAEILAAAHKSGIVHRDLKPDNILLSRDENGTDFTKILDFGVAKFVNAQNMTGKTKIGSILGTPWYMPPEQCQGFSTVDARSDIYALGCVFFQMVCGKVPFAGSLRDVLMAQVHVPPPPPHNFCPGIPPEVEGLILRMMAKQPEDRPSSMDEVAATLSEFADPAPERNKSNRRPDQLSRVQRQNRWAAPLIAALVAGLGTSAVFYFLGL